MRYLYRNPPSSLCSFLIRPRNGPRIANPVLTASELAAEFSKKTRADAECYHKNSPIEKMNKFEWADWMSPIVQVCEDRQKAIAMLGSYNKESYLLYVPDATVVRDKVIAFVEAAAHPPGEICNKRQAWFSASVLSQNLTGTWAQNNLVLGSYVVCAFETWEDATTWIKGNY